jgi:DUF4097 and DUF4098 domain-containing protein YvlB
MAIIFNLNNTGTGTLSPPILNGIEQINSDTNIEVNTNSSLTLNCTSGNIYFNGFDQFLVYNASATVDFDVLLYAIQTTIFQLNCPLINLNGTVAAHLLQILPRTTANILSIDAVEGMQVYNIDEQQMFFYQISPITFTVLGWYNSTGTIQL